MITIERDSTFADFFRAYQVVIDGKAMGEMHRDGRLHLDSLPIGLHTIRIAIDWTGSKELQFNYDGSNVNFECGSNLSGMKVLLALFYLFLPYQWCWIRQSKRPTNGG